MMDLKSNKHLRKTRLALAASTVIVCGMVSGAAQAANIAITGATAYTMGDKGKVEDATILIEGDMIKSVKSGGKVPQVIQRLMLKAKLSLPVSLAHIRL